MQKNRDNQSVKTKAGSTNERQNNSNKIPSSNKLYLFGKFMFNNKYEDQKLAIKINRDLSGKNNDLLETDVTCGRKATLGYQKNMLEIELDDVQKEIEESQEHKVEAKSDSSSYINRTNYNPSVVSFTIKDEMIGQKSTNLKKYISDLIHEGDQFLIEFNMNAKVEKVNVDNKARNSCDCRLGVGMWLKNLLCSKN